MSKNGDNLEAHGHRPEFEHLVSRMIDPEVEFAVPEDPTESYVRTLEAAGYVVYLASSPECDDDGKVTAINYEALVMESFEEALRLFKLNAQRLDDWDPSQSPRGPFGIPQKFKPSENLIWEDVCEDPRVYEAPTKLVAILGATRNAFDLDYNPAALDMLTVVEDG